MSEPKCANCRYYVPSSTPGDEPTGECRFNSPQLAWNGTELVSGWPDVDHDDWCRHFNSNVDVLRGKSGG